MKAPKCKLCGFQHWLGEPHVYARRIDSVEDVQQVVVSGVAQIGHASGQREKGTVLETRRSRRVAVPLPEAPAAPSPARETSVRETVPVKQESVKHWCPWCPGEPLGFRSQLWDWMDNPTREANTW